MVAASTGLAAQQASPYEGTSNPPPDDTIITSNPPAPAAVLQPLPRPPSPPPPTRPSASRADRAIPVPGPAVSRGPFRAQHPRGRHRQRHRRDRSRPARPARPEPALLGAPIPTAISCIRRPSPPAKSAKAPSFAFACLTASPQPKARMATPSARASPPTFCRTATSSSPPAPRSTAES